MKVLFLTNNKISYSLYKWLKEKEEVILHEDKLDVKTINKYHPDFLISYSYKYIIKEDVIEMMKARIINLHISYLPWNRGADPNLWSFIENTPKGVTIHLIDKGVDTGKILLQKEIHFEDEKETLASSYNKLHAEIQKLFKENWDKIRSEGITTKNQSLEGTFHKSKDSEEIKKLMLPEGWDIKIPILKKRYHRYKNAG